MYPGMLRDVGIGNVEFIEEVVESESESFNKKKALEKIIFSFL